MEPLKFLSDDEVKAMHEATLQIMNEVGIFWTHKSSLDILTDSGCTVKGSRVYFPPQLVEDCVAKAMSLRSHHPDTCAALPLRCATETSCVCCSAGVSFREDEEFINGE